MSDRLLRLRTAIFWLWEEKKVKFFNRNGNVKYFACDLNSIKEKIECDICIHCAGLADDFSTFDEYRRNNIDATENLINNLLNCTTLIYISSSSVYNFSDNIPKKECHVDGRNLSDYGKSKYAAEELIRRSKIPSKYILRPRAVYGADDHKLLPRIKQLVKGSILFLPGKLSTTSSLTHIQNLVEAVFQCIGINEIWHAYFQYSRFQSL